MAQGKPTASNRFGVADWMTEKVFWPWRLIDSIAIAREVMAKHRVNQLPVLDNDHLVGIVTDRDIRDAYPTSMMIDRTKAIDEFAEKVTVEEVMSHDVFVVQPETPLATAVGLLRKHRIGSLPVVKRQELVGIITRSDILDYVLERRAEAQTVAGESARLSKRKRSSESLRSAPSQLSTGKEFVHAVIRYRQPYRHAGSRQCGQYHQKDNSHPLRFSRFENRNQPGQEREKNPRYHGRRHENARDPGHADRKSGQAQSRPPLSWTPRRPKPAAMA